ncbi:MAG TPA: 3-hydroxyacyl-CoA dehydrogenase NAD-binding domain-containing protein [Bryobacteraceae bacterium]|nr:3-hydroxyacyl-CoA dehydrogenase NAD-binding domain-containing protein [Bryobacteraceae bacterium]
MNELVTLSRREDIAVITIDNPPVNALSPGVPEGLLASVQTAAADPQVKAVVVIGAGATFIAGADIREFSKIVSGERPPLDLAVVIRKIEDCPKPVVMALHGTAFGGGLEVAMGGHYRVIAPTGQVGQPEVKIGLIPGAAGTQRLPRLAGAEIAVEMCALGEPVGAGQALEYGIVDRIVEGDLLAGAIAFAREVAGQPFTKVRDRRQKILSVSPAVFSEAKDRVRKLRRGITACLDAIDAVEAATRLPFDEGCAVEREIFERCLHSRQSKALIHAFFGERTVAKIPDIPKETRVYDIRRAAVIGAGTMGGGIAMNYANAGIPVILKETTQEALDRGVATIRKNYANSVKRGRFTQGVMDQRMSLITPQLSYDGFDSVDIVVEAVFENMALKKAVFGEIDRIARPDCILATNTSTLDIDEIASVTHRPEMVVGHHFFSPANVMRLLEVVRGRTTGREVLATSMALGKKLRKVAVLAGNCRGFIGNRMIHPYLREAEFLVEEGASVEQVNDALYEFGMAMGPLAMEDLAGIDVGWRIRQESRHLEPPGVRQPLIGDRLYELGRYGQKTRRGWSIYGEDRKPSADPELAALIGQTAHHAGIARRPISNDEIVDRCVYALVNEGARLLEEGIALRAVDIDIVYLNGYGFPAWRGGPMFYADSVGLDKVLARIEEFEEQHGPELWSPAPLLRRLAETGKTFNA